MNTNSFRGLAVLAALGTSLTGCASKVSGPAADSNAPPATVVAATSPANLVKAIASDWNRLDWKSYSERLTGDFEFHTANVDSAGSAFVFRRLERDLEVEAARRMLETGAGTLPPLRSVVWTVGSTLVSEPDPRPGKTFPVHQRIRAGVVFTADAGFTLIRITGSEDFYVVRGDSAQIPDELLARGFTPDPNRWWLERWEDLAPGDPASAVSVARAGEALNALPSRAFSFGTLRELYLSPPTGRPATMAGAAR